jgi:hypothetical protein
VYGDHATEGLCEGNDSGCDSLDVDHVKDGGLKESIATKTVGQHTVVGGIESEIGAEKAAEGCLCEALGHGVGWKRERGHAGNHVVEVVTREAREVGKTGGGIVI